MDTINQEIENQILTNFKDLAVSNRVFESNIVKSGENFCSVASRFTIHYEENGRKCEKSFFLKVPYSVSTYEMLKQLNFYSKEIHMYDVVFPLYKSLLPNESLFPKYHGTDGKEALILEDLSKSGYQMQKRQEQLDLEHCAVAFKLLAKFHALGIKVHETQPQLLDPVRKETAMSSACLLFDEYCTTLKNRMSKIICRADPTFVTEHPDLLSFYENNFIKMVVRDLKAEENAFNVLNHGDFHTNNIMFAQDALGQISDAKCIDFQLCRWSSPAIDIMYFTIVCMQVEVFEKHFDSLLETYVTTLNATMQLLECSQHKLSVNDLRKDIRKKSSYYLYALILVAPIILSEQKNDHVDVLKEELLDEERYVEHSKFWISYFIKEGFFSQYEDTAVAIGTFTRKFEAENLVAISKYDLENNVVKPGENFCSGITRLKFEYQKDEKTIRDSVLLKIPSGSANYADVKQLGVYCREIFVYENLLPSLYELWNGERFSAICHTTTIKGQAIILEDLEVQGFRRCDQIQQLDLEHSRVAVATLARYHALTAKYLQKCDESVDTTLSDPFEITSSFKAVGQLMYDAFLEQAKTFVSEATHERLRKYEKKFVEMYELRKYPNTDRFNVITHGDFWTNNILFQYDDDGQVRKARMIDWQLSRKSTPVADLIYFFVSSVQFDIFRVRHEELLNLYLDTLNETMSELRCPSTYTRAELERDMEENKTLYLVCVSTVLQIILIKKDILFTEMTYFDISSQNCQSVAAKWLNYLVDIGIL